MAALGAAGYWLWQAREGKTEPPSWASVDALRSFTKEKLGYTNETAGTTLPPAERPSGSTTTNPAAPKLPETPAKILEPANPVANPEPRIVHNVRNATEAQIALARIGISVGPIDGAAGNNMRRALLAWQIHNGLPVSGELDEDSKRALTIEEPAFVDYVVTEEDLKRLMKIPSTWLGKSEAERLDYESILELAAERGRSSAEFVRKLNPQVDWAHVTAGTRIKIPRIDPPPVRERAAFARVHLYSKTLDVFGERTNLLAHFPCSIAAKVEKRPVGTLHVAKAAANPNYLFDPDVFTESAEAKKIGRRLVIPPGPNNPVGTAWIGLDKPGYGIHGTPKPEQVGRTESHGCFRLANWNAEHLLQLAWVGMPVIVEP